MTKWLAILAGGAALAVLAALLAVPALVDWNAYKPEIAERLERDLGRKVEIAGDLRLSLLPRPSISAADIRLGEGPRRGPVDLASVERLRLQLKAWPLLRGDVVVQELALIGPVAVVHIDPPPEAPPAGEDAAPAAPAPDGGAEFVVRRLVVGEGRVVVRAADTVIAEFTEVEAEVEAQENAGPAHARGSFLWNGARLQVDGALGSLTASPTSVSAALRLADGSADARLSGQLARGESDWSLRGKLSVAAKDLRRTLALAGLRGPGGAFALEGEVQGTPQALAMKDAAVRLAEAQAAGSIGLTLADPPHLDVALGFASLDLDRLLAAVEPAPAGPAPRGDGASAPADGGFSLPDGIAVAADLSADALVHRGAILRQARLAATLEGGALNLRYVGALLPGGTEASASGTLQARDGRPAVDAVFESSADNLRVTLQWLGVDVSDVPADRLRLFSASGRVVGDGQEIQVRDLDAALDASRLSGAVTLRPGPRLSFGANLAADSINLDAYLPRRAPPAVAGQAAPPAAPPPPQAPEWLRLFSAFDANLRARVGQLTVNDVTVSEVTLDGTLFNGDLTLRRAAIGELGGTSGQVSGQVAGLGRGELQVRDLAYELRSRQPEKALRFLGIDPPASAELLGSLALTGTLDGDAQGLTVKTRAETAGGVVNLAGTVTAPLTAPRYRLDVEASHASFADVVRLASPTYRPNGRLGGFALSTVIEGDAAAATLGDVRARLGPVSIAGAARLGFAGKPSLTGEFSTGAVPVHDFLPAKRAASAVPPPESPVQPAAFVPGDAGVHPGVRPVAEPAEVWSREPLDLSWLRSLDAALSVRSEAMTYDEFHFDKPVLDLAIRDGRLSVERLLATLFGGRFSLDGALSADGAAAGRLQVDGAHLREAPLRAGGVEIAGGTVSAALSLQTQGRSSLEMVSRLAGEGRLEARDGAIRGINLGEISQRLHDIDRLGDVIALLEAGRRGSTPFSRLAGTFTVANGIVGTSDLALDAEGGTAHAQATVNLPRTTVDGRVVFRLTDHPNAPSFVMLVRGPLDEPRREFDTGELRAWLAGRGVKGLMERSERAGRVGEMLERIAPGLMDQLGR